MAREVLQICHEALKLPRESEQVTKRSTENCPSRPSWLPAGHEKTFQNAKGTSRGPTLTP